MRLIDCEEKKVYEVKRISVEKDTADKLGKLGVLTGKKFLFVKKYSLGGVIVESEGVKIGMGVAVAKNIEVDKC